MGRRGSEAKAAERRIKAVELRKAGHTYREIAVMTGVTEAQAYNDVKKLLSLSLEQASEVIEEARRLELERIDALWEEAFKHVKSEMNLLERDKYIRVCVQLSKRRSELLGLDMPVKVAPTDPTGEYEFTGLTDSEASRRLVAIIAEAQEIADNGRSGNGKDVSDDISE